ncbi:dynein regulatory complex subunit 7 [Thalassophryne amazonica]|uniref:dynein regulatory complex subunit 7 n=1 Tax=Thalassophryne amazonica TaxID=390379 RepID=UPI001470CE40|nr:dynein regulatory complex subunit 7 [Thalassophryne amazonica]
MKMETVLDSDKKGEESQGVDKEDKQLVETLNDLQALAADAKTRRQRTEDPSQCPDSYKLNSSRESQMLQIANNFQRQYLHLYPDRKPLLLCPTNECGVQKFVSTSLRPSATAHSDLYTWQGCASFVADFLSLQPLKPPYNTPSYLSSPTLVLKNQRGTCFEFSTLLCSLLLGVGYDAYCVCGYAAKDMCLLDQSMQTCPLMETEQKVVMSEQNVEELKYAVKPPKELKSHFETQQEKKEQEAAKAAFLHQQQEAQRLQEESARPPPDTLHGLRVHCWVLVLSDSQDISTNFFIDPLTGKSYTTTDHHFLGVESIWNHHNYWVNMKPCSSGCEDIVFDLDDLDMWEPVLWGSTSRKQQILKNSEIYRMSHNEEGEERPKLFHMPRSWVSDITISKKDLELRWPEGHKLICYKKAELEMFAPCVMAGGLIKRLSTYKHLDYTEPVLVKQWYANRSDCLQYKEIDFADQVTTEHFSHGHIFHLKIHRYTNSQSTDSERTMEFYSQSRIDGLVRRVESPLEMTETFQDRDDFLRYRHVVFRCCVQFLEDVTYYVDNLTMQKIVERFHRNRAKPAKEDVAERVFLVAEGQISVKYHRDENQIIPMRRKFIKPQESTGKQKAQEFTPEMVSCFQVDLFEKPATFRTLQEILMGLMNSERQVVQHIKDSKQEVKDILAWREKEDRNVMLQIFPWNLAGSERVDQCKEGIESLASEEQQHPQELDALAPFMIGRNSSAMLERSTALDVIKHCLSSFEDRMVNMAIIIQERYQKVTKELQDKHQWYQQNQMDLSKEQEDQYLEFCRNRNLQLSVTMKRIDEHKHRAPQRYQAFVEKLKQDHRLASLQDEDFPNEMTTFSAAFNIVESL